MSERREIPRLLTIEQATEETGLNIKGLVYSDPEFAELAVCRFGRRVRVRRDGLLKYIERATGAPPVEYQYTRKPGRPSRAELEAAGR